MTSTWIATLTADADTAPALEDRLDDLSAVMLGDSTSDSVTFMFDVQASSEDAALETVSRLFLGTDVESFVATVRKADDAPSRRPWWRRWSRQA